MRDQHHVRSRRRGDRRRGGRGWRPGNRGGGCRARCRRRRSGRRGGLVRARTSTLTRARRRPGAAVPPGADTDGHQNRHQCLPGLPRTPLLDPQFACCRPVRGPVLGRGRLGVDRRLPHHARWPAGVDGGSVSRRTRRAARSTRQRAVRTVAALAGVRTGRIQLLAGRGHIDPARGGAGPSRTRSVLAMLPVRVRGRCCGRLP